MYINLFGNSRLLLSAFIAFTLTSHPLSLSLSRFCFFCYLRLLLVSTFDQHPKKICTTTEGKTYLLPWYTSLLNLVFSFSLPLIPFFEWKPHPCKKKIERDEKSFYKARKSYDRTLKYENICLWLRL
jgi:hypothetical protein